MQANISQEMIEEFKAGTKMPSTARFYFGDEWIKAGLEGALALVSDCHACPEDCGECSKDETCCECYAHQEMHPQTRAAEALQALYDQARAGCVTEYLVRLIARHFGFEEPR